MRRLVPAAVRRRIKSLILRLAILAKVVRPERELEPFPVGIERWYAKRSLKLKKDFPDQWRLVPPFSDGHPRLGVVMHVFYPELVDELVDGLAVIPIPFDLIVTNATGNPLTVDFSRLSRLRESRVYPIDNHGRDILPLVSVANAGLIDPYELVLKVHTKRSPWREEHGELAGSGESWRASFLSELLGDEQNVRSILARFASEPGLGVLTSSGNILGPEFWGGDEERTTHLLRRLQLDIPPERLRFAAGSMYWVRAFVLQGLRALDLAPSDFEAEEGQVDGTTAHAIERAIGILAEEAGYDLGAVGDEGQGDAESVDGDAWKRYLPDAAVRPFARAVAFYLPQFHTFPENDNWWGDGFTEWSNVTAARPVYLGHNQPLLPGELGFYDLRSEGVRDAQIALARLGGLHGFMYYYYWFAGRKLMDMPIEAHHAGQTQLPFCIMWANENWTRTWDGSEQNVLIGQDYEVVPATQFIHDVLHLLQDERYIRLDGKPLIAIYRVSQIPDFPKVVEYWRTIAAEAGLPGLTVLTVDVGTVMHGVEGDAGDFGLDGYLEFAPHNMQWSAQSTEILGLDERFTGNTMNYGIMAEAAEERLYDDVPAGRYPGVMVNFDNTARRQWRPDMWYGSNPYTFRRWLRAAAAATAERDHDQRLVFINAWNEWAESAVLEPSQRYGRTYLLAARDALHY